MALWLNQSTIESNAEIQVAFDLGEHEDSHDLNRLRHVRDLASSHEFTNMKNAVSSSTNVSSDTIDENEDDENLLSTEAWEETRQTSGGGVDHIASESSASLDVSEAEVRTVVSSAEQQSKSTSTEDHVMMDLKIVDNSNESDASFSTSASPGDVFDDAGFLPDVKAELSPAEGEAVPRGWPAEEEENDAVNDIYDKEATDLLAMGIKSEAAGVDAHHSQCVDAASQLQGKDTTISMLNEDGEPIETQLKDALESPHPMRHWNDPKGYVANRSEVRKPRTDERLDALDIGSSEGPINERDAVMEADSKAAIQDHNDIDAIIQSTLIGSPNSIPPESQDDEATVSPENDEYRDPSYGYTTIWGRKKGVTLNQYQLQNLFENNEETVDQERRNASEVNQETIEHTLDPEIASSNESLVYDQLSEMKAPKSVNTEFVEGLDDIDKFLEEVEPPDELDVGAAGSSIQEVLVGQGAQILTKHVTIILTRIKESLQASRFKKFLTSRRTEAGQLRLVTMDDLEGMLEALRSSCRDMIRNVRSFWDDVFNDDDDEDTMQFEVEETTKLDSIRQILLNQRVSSQHSATDDTQAHKQEQLGQRST